MNINTCIIKYQTLTSNIQVSKIKGFRYKISLIKSKVSSINPFAAIRFFEVLILFANPSFGKLVIFGWKILFCLFHFYDVPERCCRFQIVRLSISRFYFSLGMIFNFDKKAEGKFLDTVNVDTIRSKHFWNESRKWWKRSPQ